MTVVGYPDKPKGRTILEAFCSGIPDGRVVEPVPRALAPGAAAFYGVTDATRHLWEQARAEGRDCYYLDNAYFDGCRGRYFRATRNALQHPGVGESDGVRLGRLIYDEHTVTEPKPWRPGGALIIVAPQSDQFMRNCTGYAGNWVNDTLAALRSVTTRGIECRPWTPDKVAQYVDLHKNLPQAWAVVTWSSGCAVSGLVAGVPAFVMAEDCISRPMAFTDLRDIEKRPGWDGRRKWMEVVADNQWTLEEMRHGIAWRTLNPREMNLKGADHAAILSPSP